ncbi:permease [Lentibacillus daqui]|uniref:permease n=1 Tax=Lentibacillus daqui TaxID=2911514 RepID=UPI0022B1783C|nr:permease [Lentibacillus daqui]
MRKDNTQLSFIVLGCVFVCMAVFMLVVSIIGQVTLQQTYMLFALAVMSFSMRYLYPQFKQKDERMKFIRYKALTYSAIAFVVYYIVLSGIIQFDILPLTSMDVLNILAALMIITVFGTMVILARRN